MAKPLDYNATVQSREDVTSALAIFRILPDAHKPDESGDESDHKSDNDPWFVPGQYCVIGLNNEEFPEKGSVRRAMSIASSPQGRGPVEFYIRFVAKAESDNPLTHLLWKKKQDDRIYMKVHAAGKFTIPDTVGKNDNRWKIFVAAGTGSAPFVSMIREAVDRNATTELSQMVLLHGASYPADLGYREELQEYANKFGVRYFPTVSRPKEATDWTKDIGRVEDFFFEDRLQKLEKQLGVDKLSPNNAAVWVCGLTGTIGNCVTRLLSRGFVPDHRKIRAALEIDTEASASLFFEQYDTTPVINVKDPEVVADLKRQYVPFVCS